VGLLTTSGVDPNIGDALCIGSATLFGVHKWRSETVTARYKDNTNELIAVQLLALAGAASVFSAPQVFALAQQGPGMILVSIFFENAECVGPSCRPLPDQALVGHLLQPRQDTSSQHRAVNVHMKS